MQVINKLNCCNKLFSIFISCLNPPYPDSIPDCQPSQILLGSFNLCLYPELYGEIIINKVISQIIKEFTGFILDIVQSPININRTFSIEDVFRLGQNKGKFNFMSHAPNSQVRKNPVTVNFIPPKDRGLSFYF